MEKAYSKERGLRRLKEGVNFDDYKIKYPSAIKVKVPSIGTLEKWNSECFSKTPDGCKVEPDGSCEHGYVSWLRIMGMI